MFVIMGQKDYILKFPALKDYMSSEKLKDIAPDHEITYIPEGSHFVQEQFPELVNRLMIDFLCKHGWGSSKDSKHDYSLNGKEKYTLAK